MRSSHRIWEMICRSRSYYLIELPYGFLDGEVQCKPCSHLSGRVEVSEVDNTQRAEMLRGLVNQVTYGLDLGESETANEALRRAAQLVDGPHFAHPAAHYYENIVAVLQLDECWRVRSTHPLRELLLHIVEEMDRLRPWPESRRHR